MGMYTGFRFKGKIKEEYIPALELLHEKRVGGWDEILKSFPAFPGIHSWVVVARKNFIPFGAMNYMPASWGDQRSNFNARTRVWDFACSLKNYEHEIERFCEEVLSKIVEETERCQMLYEENETPTNPLAK